ncbi:MAG: glycosyl hydrolase family 16 [Ignavibacteriae bacterium HGW-Ignavibacteriae-2]|jgi:beta-glucanase (GH16 family)|nr:glycoside hydrolase family 16 protein [Bacteroidota bacterium]PKL88172.1 MAG: glycosyl hydrolase family 16 [Ignavibacteriae bacterium HGW-Ignavibacteriae-2]
MIVKKILILVFSLLLSSAINYGCSKDDNPAANNDIAPDYDLEGYTLLWQDEFDGSKVDPLKWIYEVNGNGGGNNELQYYTDREENSFVKDGALHIVALQEEFTGSDGKRYYTSARMTTQETKSFMYGRIEAKLKLPYGQGIWPAFWMLGLNISEVGWPKCGEIDIMEMIGGGDGRDNVTHGTLHWDDNGHKYQGGNKKISSGILADDFHVYAIQWDANKIEWFFDNEPFYSMSITPASMSEFHQHYFIILNLAVGGNWPGNPDMTTKWPQEMIVDYVRVYEKE